MKKILGLDLGTNSIGWALVNEAENENEKSSIIKLGVRVNPLTVDELTNFEKGKSITTNADRTLKRSMRRNLQRYKLRKENLIEILKQNKFIANDTILSENGNKTTFETYRLRAKAVNEAVTLEQFARILIMINGKRGYKSSRKAKSQDEGQLIDGMEIAKKLYNENITPGQLVYQILKAGKKYIPDFYRSDLQNELDKIWEFQKQFEPEILTDDFKKQIAGKGKMNTTKIFLARFGIYTADNKGADKRLQAYQWRVAGLTKQLTKEELAFVISDVNGTISGSSGYLGSISDRSKELFFNKQTVGQYLMVQLEQNPHTRLKNQVFYRQDYLDEFNAIWETQAKFHKELTNELKSEIRDVIIFYQRRLKSQKGLVKFCEFEYKIAEFKKDILQIKKCQLINFKNKTIAVLNQQGNRIKIEEILVEKFFNDFSIDGKLITKEFKQRLKIDDNEKLFYQQGQHVIPKSSPLFQEFKIWQQLNNIEVYPVNEKNRKKKPNARILEKEEKAILYSELSIKDRLPKEAILTMLDLQDMDMNFNSIDGNKTRYEFLKAYKEIIELSGHEIDEDNIIDSIKAIFKGFGIKTDVLDFDSEMPLEEQSFFRLWHLLYSFEGDNSDTGNKNLINRITELYSFEKEFARILANVTFQNDYANLSSKAIGKILPHLKDGEHYDVACVLAGYGKHSASSLTREELDNKVYKNTLDILPKNSLRNPVVEKILNQMINVINCVIDTYGEKNVEGEIIKKPFDEIRIELARELKKNADERFLLTGGIDENTKGTERIKKILQEEFGISTPSRNDIIRYKLWQELAPIGYKPLYSSKENRNREISPSILFTKEVEIEHILPKARLFDDSQSNKTLAFHSDNQNKGDKTAIDYIIEVDGENGLEEYLNRIIIVCGKKMIKKVIKNQKGEKSIKSEEKTFDLYRKEYEKTLKKKEAKDKWNNMSEIERRLAIINKYYSGKLKKLIITGKDIPDGFINRDLGNTQYISKYAKTMLGDLVKFVISTTGSITDRLREDWQLIDVMPELNWEKYDKLDMTETIENRDGQKIRRIKDWSKRNDHRHHAMDALTVAFTKRSFVQYLNNLNARRTSEEQGISNSDKSEKEQSSITTEDIILTTYDVMGIEKKELYRDKNNKLRFNPPMPLGDFRAEAKKHLENTLISIKAKNKVTTININTTKKKNGVNKKEQLTPRGQLHQETVYGKINWSRIKLTDKISKIELQAIKDQQLKQFIEDQIKKHGSIKNAFSKENLTTLRFKDKLITELTINIPCYTQKIDIQKYFTDNKKSISARESAIESIIDIRVRKILYDRYFENQKDFKKAFSNLAENPIWLNKEKGIAIKRVTITGISNAVALHDKKDKEGKLILDKEGKTQPVDFVNTGNNHHVAIYKDENGNLQENVIPFFVATERVSQGLPIIDKSYKNEDGWEFLFSMKQNEYFVFPNEKNGFNPSEIDLSNPDNYQVISPNLFRVQKLSTKNYVFNHHLETTAITGETLKNKKQLSTVTYHFIQSLPPIKEIVKVRINHIGQIVSVGEY